MAKPDRIGIDDARDPVVDERYTIKGRDLDGRFGGASINCGYIVARGERNRRLDYIGICVRTHPDNQRKTIVLSSGEELDEIIEILQKLRAEPHVLGMGLRNAYK